MAQHESKAQKNTVGRVMHEYKHGELESSRGGKVKSRKQAVAIALSEAGASKSESRRKTANISTRPRKRNATARRPRRSRKAARSIRRPGSLIAKA